MTWQYGTCVIYKEGDEFFIIRKGKVLYSRFNTLEKAQVYVDKLDKRAST